MRVRTSQSRQSSESQKGPTTTVNGSRPAASSVNALHTMQANRATSGLEVRFRKALWAEGVRGYRLKRRLPGRPDLVFSRLKLAVFVHGCFWHRCGACDLPWPKANAEFWATKLKENVARDAANIAALQAAGWASEVIWEHELRKDLPGRARGLAEHVARLRRAAGSV